MARIHYWELSNYNNGRLIGKWFELDGLTHNEHRIDIKEWLNGLTEKTGELCEEYIVGDSEGIPDKYVGEYSIDSDYFDYVSILESTNLDPEVFEAGIELGIDPEYIREYYYGHFNSIADFAENYLECTGGLDGVPDHLINHIDFESYGRELLDNCASEQDGHYFLIG